MVSERLSLRMGENLAIGDLLVSEVHQHQLRFYLQYKMKFLWCTFSYM